MLQRILRHVLLNSSSGSCSNNDYTLLESSLQPSALGSNHHTTTPGPSLAQPGNTGSCQESRNPAVNPAPGSP
ncbi:hypothetical protein EV356DRAFT_135166 [Viridothelium virens]|uniref:Uncharacterized protein n=1 Tax=Viridothelium virens TaxID=1048519 RepID=A0A6A6HC69_VIRVR|nr:hypothetical protein EV356DRAFT_135166 [Viridothelium virens]